MTIKTIHALHSALEIQARLSPKRSREIFSDWSSYAVVEMIGRYHAPRSLEGWILVKAEYPKALYEHEVEWTEYL